ncbi:MAG: ABC transporter ATP-binding protein [Microbacteriaceae bacterium]|nr:ABC transporter ATP-binding protein [Microbacteriaceae bacterium]
MTEPTPSEQPQTPSRKDRLRPAELLIFAGVLAVFSGLIVLLVLRTPDGVADFAKAGIVAGSVFIIVLIIVALLGLGGDPSDEDLEARKDLQDPNRGH